VVADVGRLLRPAIAGPRPPDPGEEEGLLVDRQTSVSDNSAAIAAVSTTGVQYATKYTYDALNRLTGVSWNPAPTVTALTSASSVRFDHIFSRANQRVSQSVGDNGWISYPGSPGTMSYSANNLNQYTAVGSIGPTYDNNGNLTSDVTYTRGDPTPDSRDEPG
jgi:hypothetical protein